jgi:hypothetical protein
VYAYGSSIVSKDSGVVEVTIKDPVIGYIYFGHNPVIKDESVDIFINNIIDTDKIEYYAVYDSGREELLAVRNNPRIHEKESCTLNDASITIIRVKAYGLNGNIIQKGEPIRVINTYSLSHDGETYLSTNFKVKRFACKDGTDTTPIDSKLVNILQTISDHFGKTVTITSGYRTVTYNSKIGGEKNSFHTRGMAADITISGVQPLTVARYAESIGVQGIGLYENSGFVHVDSRDFKHFWVNSGDNIIATFTDE